MWYLLLSGLRGGRDAWRGGAEPPGRRASSCMRCLYCIFGRCVDTVASFTTLSPAYLYPCSMWLDAASQSTWHTAEGRDAPAVYGQAEAQNIWACIISGFGLLYWRRHIRSMFSLVRHATDV